MTLHTIELIHTPQDITRFFTIASNKLPSEIFNKISHEAKHAGITRFAVSLMWYASGKLMKRNPIDYRNFESAGEYYRGISGKVPLMFMNRITYLQNKYQCSFQEAHKIMQIDK